VQLLEFLEGLRVIGGGLEVGHMFVGIEGMEANNGSR
jgi:hypothetical protein